MNKLLSKNSLSKTYNIFSKYSIFGLYFIILSSISYFMIHIYLYMPFQYESRKIYSPLLSILVTDILSISCLLGAFIVFLFL